MTNTKISLETSRDWLIGLVTNETFIYVMKRLLQALLTIFLASALSFFIMKLSPGDYVDTLRQNPKISPERIEEIRRQFGLDKSWPEQFGFWLKQIITKGDFGTSFVYQRSVSSLLWERVPATLLLAIASLIITWVIAIPLGILAAVKQNRKTDQILQIVSYAGQGIPSFITVLFLLFFAQLTTHYPLPMIYYIIRSRSDGKYLTARVDDDTSGYLLLFKEDFEAMSYLNTHAADLANRLTVEPLASNQIGSLLKRWGFAGVGIVNDPLLPEIEFLQHI